MNYKGNTVLRYIIGRPYMTAKLTHNEILYRLSAVKTNLPPLFQHSPNSFPMKIILEQIIEFLGVIIVFFVSRLLLSTEKLGRFMHTYKLTPACCCRRIKPWHVYVVYATIDAKLYLVLNACWDLWSDSSDEEPHQNTYRLNYIQMHNV